MQPRLKRVYLPRIKLLMVALGAILFAVIVTKIFVWSQRFMRETGLTPGTVIRLAFDAGAQLKSLNGRTNVLLLGIGGGSHMGADLTDTMMVLSVDSENHSLAIISIPRDIWSDTLKDKVNSAYHYGEEKKKGGGLVLAKAITEDIIGLPVHYSLVIDFSGFKEIIDLVGGVTVNVSKVFTDTEFPIEGKENDECGGDPTFRCRYETIHFDAGLQHMDGIVALKYVRSREAEGEEGSDFARSRRQQEVLVDLKKKLTSPITWASPSRARLLVSAFDAATDTDMNIGEFLTIGKLLSKTPEKSIQRISFEDLLISPPINWYGRYVLLPKESFENIHETIRTLLK